MNQSNQTALAAGLIIAAGIAILPQSAEAQALFNSGTTFLEALVDLLTNLWVRLFAIIAIVSMGVAAMFQRLSWVTMGIVTAGMVITLSAAAIVDSVEGTVG